MKGVGRVLELGGVGDGDSVEVVLGFVLVIRDCCDIQVSTS